MQLLSQAGRGRLAASTALTGTALAGFLAIPALAETAPGAVADLVEKASPAVVTILATPSEQAEETAQAQAQDPFGPGSPFEEFFRQFGMPQGRMMPMPGPREREEPRSGGVSLGSGFVMESDGYIITNNHVVDNAGKVTVRLTDNREFPAKVIGTDTQSDLALLKIDAGADLPTLPLGDSDRTRVGDDVIAVGNPFGLGGTVTRGIVSALGRDINAGPYVDFIQTDAAINRGNSGGPLLNLEGEVIGVNSAIFSPNGGSVGVGFAIPADTVETVVAQLRDHGAVERGWLGVSIQEVTPDLAAAMRLPDAKGALVSQVVPGGPSETVLQPGDVIVAFDGTPIAESRDLPKAVAAQRPDAKATVTILRDGDRQDVTVALGRFDAEKVTPAALTRNDRQEAPFEKLGATLAPLTDGARSELGVGPDAQGVVMTSLGRDSRAGDAGLQVGDVVTAVNGTPVRTTADVEKAMAEAPANAVLLQIARGENRLFLGVPLA